MNPTYQRVMGDIQSYISQHPNQNNLTPQQIESIIIYIAQSIEKMKMEIIKDDFPSITDEIYFFKHFKPQIVSLIIIYNSIYRTEIEKPSYCSYSEYRYYKRELKKIKLFFEENHQFYQYYKANQNYLDEKYFIRNRHNIKLLLAPCIINFNFDFSTSHDFKVAELIAFEHLKEHFEQKMKNYHDKKLKNPPFFLKNSPLVWTYDKSALIEIIYALYATKVINHGQITIKKIASTFGKVLGINLDDYARVHGEMKKRKTNHTKYLDAMRTGYLTHTYTQKQVN